MPPVGLRIETLPFYACVKRRCFSIEVIIIWIKEIMSRLQFSGQPSCDAWTLFSGAMSSDFLLREQFVTDPAQILSEYVYSKKLPSLETRQSTSSSTQSWRIEAW